MTFLNRTPKRATVQPPTLGLAPMSPEDISREAAIACLPALTTHHVEGLRPGAEGSAGGAGAQVVPLRRDHDAWSGLVFTAPKGGPIDLNVFRRRVWAKAVAATGLNPLRIHDLRHTCASLAIQAGADVKSLQRMLGHASAAMTLDRYGHLMPGQAEAVADRLDVLRESSRRGA